jgi:hypothetical protein
MYESDAFTKREQALEDEFFHRVDEKLRAELRRSMDRDRSREALAEATGLTDKELLDGLIEAGFQSTTLAALALVPAIFVAWADNSADELECQTIMKAATERGINEDAVALQLLETWLKKRPPKSLWETWKRYAHAVGESLSESNSTVLSGEILRLATAVAESSGGVLGFGKTSKSEQEVLDEIKEVMEFRS